MNCEWWWTARFLRNDSLLVYVTLECQNQPLSHLHPKWQFSSILRPVSPLKSTGYRPSVRSKCRRFRVKALLYWAAIIIFKDRTWNFIHSLLLLLLWWWWWWWWFYHYYACNRSSVCVSGCGRSGIDLLYTVSYLWYPSIGAATVVVVGLIVSFITGTGLPHTRAILKVSSTRPWWKRDC